MSSAAWRVKVGIEIHARISCLSKLFSGASSNFTKGHGLPNSQVALFDCGMPGSLPVLNVECVNQVLRTSLALKGKVNRRSVFERKHYFYGDSPLGFQITQQRAPVVTGGSLSVVVDGKQKDIGITRIQLEQDTGRTLQGGGSKSALAPEGMDLVDLNRAGSGLMEIVSEPDMSSAEEAGAYVRAMRELLKHIGTCDGNMEDGSLRADINISVHNDTVDSPRIEIKNLNSVRHVIKAVQFETDRLITSYNNNEPIVLAETRSFDIATGETTLMRIKEGAVDYRFFPEPDLPVLLIEGSQIESIKDSMPELFTEALERLMTSGLSEYEALVLLGEKGALSLFDKCNTHSVDNLTSRLISSFICNELLGALSAQDKILSECDALEPLKLCQLLSMVHDQTITMNTCKKVLELWVKDDFASDPVDIIQQKKWFQINDKEELRKLCEETVKKLQASKRGEKLLREYVGGKLKVFEYFFGNALGRSKGLANPQALRVVLLEVLQQVAQKEQDV